MKPIGYFPRTIPGLSRRGSLNHKLGILLRTVRLRFPAVDRIAVALYERGGDRVKTYLASGPGPNLLTHYEISLSETASLKKMVRNRRVRIVPDLNVFASSNKTHSRLVRAMGYGSSCTFPLMVRDRVMGFIFFNSLKKNAFDRRDLPLLELYAHLVAELATRYMRSACVMFGALKTAGDLLHYRDPETGCHLDRMARYARLIAQELGRSRRYHLTDERVESIELFAPMHDVGKMGIPDRILLKRGILTPREWRVMRRHTTLGRQIVDALIENFGLASFERADVLRHIAEFHHESMDGSGYPRGLKGTRIPIEARIVAVADVFDALTSRRAYKSSWTNDKAFETMERLSRTTLDRHCVQALAKNRASVEQIQKRFREAKRRLGNKKLLIQSSDLVNNAIQWC